MPRDGRGEVAYRGRAPLLHDRSEPGLGRGASEQPDVARPGDRDGSGGSRRSPRDGPGQRRVHELHALARAARRSARDHGVTPPLRVELRRDRRRPAGTHRSSNTLPTAAGSPTSASRRTSRWSDRCVGTSTSWWPRRSPPMPGATTSAGSSPRAPGSSARSGTWRTRWSGGPTWRNRGCVQLALTASRTPRYGRALRDVMPEISDTKQGGPWEVAHRSTRPGARPQPRQPGHRDRVSEFARRSARSSRSRT